MDRKQSLMQEINKLRQKRWQAEKRCEKIDKMLAACLIFRARVKGKRGLQSMKSISSDMEYKRYGYLSCFYRGRNIYKYVGRNELEKVARLTETYRIFCQNMKEVRWLNIRIVELLDKIGEIQTEEIKRYVKTRTKRVCKKKRRK